jgi:hypothetical protein
LSLLPFKEYPETTRPERTALKKTAELNDLMLTHRNAEMVFPLAAGGAYGLAEKHRGEFIHAALSFLQYIEGTPDTALDAAINRAVIQSNNVFDYDLRSLIMSFLAMPEIAPYFERRPGRQVWNEKEVADSTGRLYRIDRLVEDNEGVTIIDYKTGNETGAEDGYLDQLRRYIRIIKDIYPDRSVSGMIAYIDLHKVRRVS